MSIWSLGAGLPRLILDVLRVVASLQSPSQAELDELRYRCRSMKKSLLQWRSEYDGLSRLPAGKSERTDLRYEILGNGLIMQGAACRLVGAVSPADRVSEECEAVAHSLYMKRLIRETSDKNQWARFYLEQKIIYADAILNTTEVWLEACQEPTNNSLIDGWRFKIWCDSLSWHEKK